MQQVRFKTASKKLQDKISRLQMPWYQPEYLGTKKGKGSTVIVRLCLECVRTA
ncbi:MAG: hypothetical protein OEX98_01535 [Nitrosopumilus sp.]|nr:hypothetical protein [Nitrosopumilus sp.]